MIDCFDYRKVCVEANSAYQFDDHRNSCLVVADKTAILVFWLLSVVSILLRPTEFDFALVSLNSPFSSALQQENLRSITTSRP